MRNRFADAVSEKLTRCREIIFGIGRNRKYSNGLAISLNRVLRRNAPETVYVWENRFRMVANCERHEHMALHEVFVDRIYAPLLDRCVFDSDQITFVEVGANIGAFDLWLVTRGLRVKFAIAVELNPSTFERCKQNLEENGLSAVRVVNAAAAKANGWIDFVPNEHAMSDSIFDRGDRLNVAPVRVEMVTLATLLDRNGATGRAFSLLKLDCEGSEYEILRTTELAILRQFRYILIEFHSAPFGESLTIVYEVLANAGFRALSDLADEPTFLALFVSVGA